MGSNERKHLETEKLGKWRYEHIAVRPATFVEFRRLKNTRSDNVFLMKLMHLWKIKMEKENK